MTTTSPTRPLAWQEVPNVDRSQFHDDSWREWSDEIGHAIEGHDVFDHAPMISAPCRFCGCTHQGQT